MLHGLSDPSIRNVVLVAGMTAAVLSGHAPGLYAQETDSLVPGVRLRVTSSEPARKPIVGTLTALDASSLTIQTSKGPVTMRREWIQTAEISQRRSFRRRGALIGAGVGALAAIVLAATDKQEPFCLFETPCSGDPLFSRNDIALGAAALLVPVGAGLGAAVSPGERWVALKAPLVAERQHGRGAGFRVQVTLRF